MKHRGIICSECKSLLFSRAHYDFRRCKCGRCYIDGGFDYIRIGGACSNSVLLEIEKTRKELYDDWNTQKEKFGLHSSVRPPKWIKFEILNGIDEIDGPATIEEPTVVPTNAKTLTPKQCAEQFRMYASSHPLKDSQHSLNFCADFLDQYCKE